MNALVKKSWKHQTWFKSLNLRQNLQLTVKTKHVLYHLLEGEM